MKSRKPSGVQKLFLVVGAAIAGIFVSRKVAAGGPLPRRRGDGGGLTGVREPRRPRPTTPSDGAAIDPREDELASVAGHLSG